MRRRLKAVLIPLVIVGSIAGWTGSVAAQVPPSDDQAWGGLIDDDAEVGVRDREFQAGAGGGETSARGNPNITCRYSSASGGRGSNGSLSRAQLEAEYDAAVANGQEGVMVFFSCVDNSTGEAVPVLAPGQSDPGEPFVWSPSLGLYADPEALANEAKNRMQPPAPIGDMSPSLSTGTFANLQTFIWAANWDQPTPTATASAGSVTATVTATPARQVWYIEDAIRGPQQPVVCNDQGVQYSPAAGTSQPVGCGWIPPHSSAGQPSTHDETGEACFDAVIVIEWDVYFTSTGAGGEEGSLGTLTSSASTCIVVQELQAVVSSDGDG